jgi:hypothetical protein
MFLWYTLTEPISHKQTTKESIDYSRYRLVLKDQTWNMRGW